MELELEEHDNNIKKYSDPPHKVKSAGNAYFIIGKDCNYLIDVLSGTYNLWERLQNDISENPLVILLTHAHADHTRGLRHFPAVDNVRVYIHPSAVNDIKNGKDRDEVIKNGEVSKKWNEAELQWKGNVFPLMNHQTFPVNEKTSIEVIFTEGHSIDSVCFWMPSYNIIYTGDAYYPDQTMKDMLPYIFQDVNKYLESLKMLSEKPYANEKTWYFPGHGNVVDQTKMKQDTKQMENMKNGKDFLKACKQRNNIRAKQKRPAIICGYCKTKADKMCGNCLNSFYCSVSCQVQHWKQHKEQCRK